MEEKDDSKRFDNSDDLLDALNPVVKAVDEAPPGTRTVIAVQEGSGRRYTIKTDPPTPESGV